MNDLPSISRRDRQSRRSNNSIEKHNSVDKIHDHAKYSKRKLPRHAIEYSRKQPSKDYYRSRR